MSTIVVVKKDGLATIAADTLTTFGNTKESAEYIVNSEKIFKYRENYLGISGSASLAIAVQDFLERTKKKVSFENSGDIFRFGLNLHKELKETYFYDPTMRKILRRFAVIFNCQSERNFRLERISFCSGIFKILCQRQRQRLCSRRNVCSL